MHTTNYRDTLITPSADCAAGVGTTPAKPGTIAALQHELLAAQPYALTSDDLLFAVHAHRTGANDRDAFFAKPQACLRASPLVKQFGWALHHDEQQRVALVARESDEYRRLLEEPTVTKVGGMRSKRA